jgi:hypothetical protein
VAVPGFNRSLVDPRLYLKPFGQLHGFARLLFLEERDFQHSRLMFTDQVWGWHESLGFSRLSSEMRDNRTTSILDHAIVSSVIDYNHGVLLPQGSASMIFSRLENRASRILCAFSADQKFNHVQHEHGIEEELQISDADLWSTERKPHIYFIFASSFEEILDAKNFSMTVGRLLDDAYDDNGVTKEDVVIDVPRNIGFIGSLQEYVESLPTVVDDWFSSSEKPPLQ